MWVHNVEAKGMIEPEGKMCSILLDVKLITRELVSADIAGFCTMEIPDWKKRGLFVAKKKIDSSDAITQLTKHTGPIVNKICETHLVESEPDETKLFFFYIEKRL